MVCVGCRFSKKITIPIKMTENVMKILKKPNTPPCNWSRKKNHSTDNTATNTITLTVFFRLLTCQNIPYLIMIKKCASALFSPDRQMFLGKKSPHFDFYFRRLFDPMGYALELKNSRSGVLFILIM